MGSAALEIESFLASVTADEWKNLSRRLTRYAFATIRHRSWHEAEDLAQSAFLAVIDPNTRSWDRGAQPAFFEHLASLVRVEASRRRMVHRRRRETEYEEENEQGDTPETNPKTRSHEEELLHEERGRRVMAAIRERARGDEHLLKVLGLLEAGVDTMAEHAAHIGITLMEARNARVRLRRLVERIEKELDAQGEAKHDR